jgi:hypothetical protein
MFHDNAKPAPNLWEHTTGGQPVYAWMPDVSMEAENVEPIDLENDYMAALPASRLRSIGMGRNLGSAPFIMSQTDRHWQGDVSTALANQMVGWVLAHDALPEQVPFWTVLSSELELWRDDVRFLPYWKTGTGVASETAGVNVSAHVRPGSAVLWLVNTTRQDQSGRVRLDLKSLGLGPTRSTVAYDAETGERYSMDAGVLSVPVPKRMWRAVRLIQPNALKGNITFVADFDREVAASEAYGGRYPLGKSLPLPVPGRLGNGVALDAPLAFLARQHVASENGRISFAVRFRSAPGSDGALVGLGPLTLVARNGRLSLTAPQSTVQQNSIPPPVADLRWHSIALSWRGREVQVTCDGVIVLSATLKDAMQLPGMGRGSDIRDNRRHIEPARITFGPVPGAVLDDLQMEGRP